MQTKDQKRFVALERIEERLKTECQQYDSASRNLDRIVGYMSQANNIRRALSMTQIEIDYYSLAHKKLILNIGPIEFYSKENQDGN